MTHIAESDLVLAPLASAERFLRAVLAASPARQRAGARIVLRAAEIAQPVIAFIESAHRPGDITARYSISWKAESGGPHPQFNGELIVNADRDYNGFWLVLTGSYVPPDGPAARFSDAVLGRRIARSTARSLLRELRVAIEANFRTQEPAEAS